VRSNKPANSLALDFPIDEVSLSHAQKQFESDHNLDEQTKLSMLALINHVSDQSKYIAHSDRKSIYLKDFLSDMHFMSAKAYELYASDLLKKHITYSLGSVDIKEDQAAVIDWQLGHTRTSPVD